MAVSLVKRTDLLSFKSLAKARKKPSGAVLLNKAAVTTVTTSGEDRIVRFVISTGAVDRDQDTVAVEGWDLSSYRTNPVVLWGHDAGALPIGKCIEIGVSDGALRAAVEFVPADMPVVGALAEAVLRMCRDGFLSATSVGFRPMEWKITDQEERGAEDWCPGVDFLRQELMEFSVVSIPSNPEALMEVPEPGVQQMAAREGAAKSVQAALRASLATKGLYDISSLASLVGELGWLRESVGWEAETEGDGSTVPAQLGEALRILGEALVAMAAEEVAELLAQAAQQSQRAAVAAARKQRQRDAIRIAFG